MSWIIPYRGQDIARMKARGDFMGTSERIDAQASFTLIASDRWTVKGCGGAVVERPGVVTLWGRCADDLTVREWLMIRDHVRTMIARLLAWGVLRVQSFCYASDGKATGFLAQLGLSDDVHTLRAYGPDGADFVVAAKLGRAS